MQDFGAEFGKLIKHQRERLNFTQADLAKEIEITQVALSRMENGKVARPRASTEERLSNALNIEPNEIELLRSGETLEAIIERIQARERANIEDDLISANLRKLLEDVIAGRVVSLEALRTLATAFGNTELTDRGELERFLSLKAEEYRALKSEVDSIDDGLKRLSNLKAAAHGAIDRVDLDEVEDLLSRVQEVELEEAAKTAELRANNALLRGRVEQAYRILCAAADSFAAVDPQEPARRRLCYEDTLFQHGLRYGGPGIELSEKMIRQAIPLVPKHTVPQQWADAQNQLGIALQNRGIRTDGPQGAQLLADAVTAYRAALEVHTRADHPVAWAMTKNNLAIALQEQGVRTDWPQGAQLLVDAVTAYCSALEVYTRADHPVQWAMTKNNLGNALRDQGMRTDGPQGGQLLADAVTAYRDALEVRTRADHPVDWAATQNNLGNALKDQGSRTDGPEGAQLLADAVTAYRAAIEGRTRPDNPVHWAESQVNIAVALAVRAARPDAEDARGGLIDALAAVDGALEVFDPEHMSFHHTNATRLRDFIQSALAALPD
ncbi:MAG: helix-turn-helix domain-containing protein [Pseudomonadota bacterium]